MEEFLGMKMHMAPSSARGGAGEAGERHRSLEILTWNVDTGWNFKCWLVYMLKIGAFEWHGKRWKKSLQAESIKYEINQIY